jgi:hypothetical protein
LFRAGCLICHFKTGHEYPAEIQTVKTLIPLTDVINKQMAVNQYTTRSAENACDVK